MSRQFGPNTHRKIVGRKSRSRTPSFRAVFKGAAEMAATQQREDRRNDPTDEAHALPEGWVNPQMACHRPFAEALRHLAGR